MDPVGVVIFVVVYVLVSARRIGHLGLDRPSAAMLGAVACVAFGVLDADDAIAAVDGGTLLLLLGVMGMGAFLVVDGAFDVIEARLEGLVRRPRVLLAAVIWGAGVMSAFITNDAVCLLGAPLLVRLIRRFDLPAMPFLLGLATAANTGSAATLVGNPQNMLCGELGDLSYLAYLKVAGPVAVVGLAVNHAFLAVAFRRVVPASITVVPRSEAVPALAPRHAVTVGVIAATAIVYALGASLAWTAAGGFVVLMLLHRRATADLWRQIDWSLLLFFAGLFVVVEGLRESGATAWWFAGFPLDEVLSTTGWPGLATVFLLGSNLVSNVPFILVVQDELAGLARADHGWTLLALTSTFAGNLTLLGSAANVIVAEAGREVGGFGFWQHVRVGFPIAVVTTAIAVMWTM
ncbi:MAG: arsenic transporter [Myxococcales bacterium]|nr:arsenic transporter [Myxococcales bacterium]